MAQWSRTRLSMQEMWVPSRGWEYLLEKEMATPSSILVWRIPWTEEPGGLQPMGSQSLTRLSTHAGHTQAHVHNKVREITNASQH